MPSVVLTGRESASARSGSLWVLIGRSQSPCFLAVLLVMNDCAISNALSLLKEGKSQKNSGEGQAEARKA